jgi:hypothetical protein
LFVLRQTGGNDDWTVGRRIDHPGNNGVIDGHIPVRVSCSLSFRNVNRNWSAVRSVQRLSNAPISTEGVSRRSANDVDRSARIR